MRVRPQWLRACTACAFILAATSAAFAGVSAWRLEPLPVGSRPAPQSHEDAVPVASVSEAQLTVLLETDPFHPERRRPDERYGATRAEPSEASDAPERPGATVHLLGTVVLPAQRSLAMCRVGNDKARLLRVGDTLGNMRLAEIGQGRAVFVDGRGERMDLRVLKGGT